MKRLALLSLLSLLVVAVGCPGEKKEPPKIPVDTPKTDLSQLPTNVPAAAPDTFKQRTLTPSGVDAGRSGPPDAPPALYEAVQREQSFSRFCFTEFGKKADPSLAGNVAMYVTVGQQGISDVKVGAANWSGAAGQAVNRCLNQKAKSAWKLAPGVVKPGEYSVRLSFTGA